jgi:hypothetical protein
LHAPLIIRAPGMSFRGLAAGGLVESIDIYPTIAQLCGVTAPAGINGTSLVPLIHNPDAPGKPWVYSAFEGNEETVRTAQWRLVASGSTPVYDLYDLQATPFELNDVSAEQSAVVSELVENKLHVQPARLATLRFDTWKAAHFSAQEQGDPEVSGFTANPDQDASLNAFEYVAGSDPRDGFSGFAPAADIEDLTTAGLPGRWLTFRFRASSLVDDVQLLPEFSTDLAQWSAADAVYLRTLELTPTLNEYVFRPSVPLSAGLRAGFWRLKLTNAQ